MNTAGRRLTLLLGLALLNPLYAQADSEIHSGFRGQGASGITRQRVLTVNRASSNFAGEMALDVTTGETRRSALQTVPEMQGQNERRLPILPIMKELESLNGMRPDPNAKTARMHLKGGSKYRNVNLSSKSIKGLKGENKVKGKGSGNGVKGDQSVKTSNNEFIVNEPVPTKPNRPSAPTGRPMTPPATPVNRPTVAASPFDVGYLVGRRLSEGRQLQTSGDFFEASKVTIDYLQDYVIAYFQKRGVEVASVQASSTTFSAEPLQIGYVLAVTFKRSAQAKNVVDTVILMALTTDGELLVDELKSELAEQNPFSQTSGVTVKPSDDSPSEPTTGPAQGPTISTPTVDSPAPFSSVPGSPTSSPPTNTLGPTRTGKTTVPTINTPSAPSVVDPPTSIDSQTPTASPEPTRIDTLAPSSVELGPTVSSPTIQQPTTLAAPSIDTFSPGPSASVPPTAATGTPTVSPTTDNPAIGPNSSPTVE